MTLALGLKNTFTLVSPISVLLGDVIGLYFPGQATVPFDGGGSVLHADNNSGFPGSPFSAAARIVRIRWMSRQAAQKQHLSHPSLILAGAGVLAFGWARLRSNRFARTH